MSWVEKFDVRVMTRKNIWNIEFILDDEITFLDCDRTGSSGTRDRYE